MFGTWTDYSPFDRFDRLFAAMDSARAPAAARPALDIEELEGGWRVSLAVPGLSVQDIAVTVDADRNLLISGERKVTAPEGYRSLHGERPAWRFQRSLSLPREVDLDGVSAQARNGVLTITLPRSARATARSIPVNA